MKPVPPLAVLFLLTTSAFSRLGETREQTEVRYGLPKRELSAGTRLTLIEGALELSFKFEGWIIRCALLPATDGREYIVKEEYRKDPAVVVRNTQNPARILDEERDAVLNAQAGPDGWHLKTIGQPETDPLQVAVNQLGRSHSLSGNLLVRGDRAIGQVAWDNIILSLPQAFSYEAQIAAIKQQKAKSALPKF
ncbi:MAG: hypothetical protein JWL90_1310 [Chthoniobacteraceae bacterium]|nr:hypothetical protein [Chthoniobacteraceae bacterium]